MKNTRIFLFLFLMIFFAQGVGAQLQEPEARMDMKNLIRRESICGSI